MKKNPILPKKITDQLLYTTVRICGLTQSNQTSTGTGFFFHIELENKKQITLLLTNKHVITDCKELNFCLHEAINVEGNLQPSGNFINIKTDNFNQHWIPHPTNNIDLGAIIFGPIISEVKSKLDKEIFYRTLDKNLIKNDEELTDLASVAEEVLMPGYPIGLWDEYNNHPIVRKGIAASPPASNFQNKNIGVVDIACFPGSSGSPILIYNEGAIMQSDNQVTFGTKTILLGLLYAGPFHTDNGEIQVKEIPTHQNIVSINKQMIHIGYYVKAKEIQTLCKHILSKYADELKNDNG